jgi:phosphoribosylglycinamide formyltransferase 1
MPPARIAVLASGSGTLLHAIVGDGVPVALVAADRPCRALEIAAEHGIPAELVERTDWGPSFDRTAYTQQLVKVLRAHDVDLVVMAGFGTVVPGVTDAYPGRVLNSHPALLPAFKGWHAVRDALTAGVKVTGTTIHVATADVDDGPILAQEAVPVLPDDTEETLHERIKQVEWRLYPATIRRFVADTFGEVPGGRAVARPLGPSGPARSAESGKQGVEARAARREAPRAGRRTSKPERPGAGGAKGGRQRSGVPVPEEDA